VKEAEVNFVRMLAKNHPILTPTEKNWLESGELLSKMCRENGFMPDKLRNLHFDVLIALTARNHGAIVITSNKADFELIRRYRNFNLEVKCPGVHYMKTHGKSDEDITSQLQMDKSEIDACEAWAAAQPKGYVPPPATGTTAQAGGSPTAPAPAKPQ